MIKLLYLISILLLSNNLRCEDEDDFCDPTTLPDIGSFAGDLQIPNCNTRKIKAAANKGDFSKLCKDCKPRFEKAASKYKDLKLTPQNYNLNKILENELKRNISANLMDAVKVQAIFSSNADYSEAIKACNFDKFEERLANNSCAKVDLSGIKNQLAEETARLIHSKPIYDGEGVLDRTYAKNSCEISDIAILRAKTLNLEEAISDDAVKFFTEIKTDDKEAFEMALATFDESKGYPFTSSLSSHPFFAQYMSPPSAFRDFFKSLKRPTTTETIRAKLYTSKKTGDKFTQTVADRCKKGFDTFEKIACDSDFKKGKVRIGDIRSSKRFMSDQDTSSDEYLDLISKTQIQSNLELIGLCNINTDKNEGLDFTKELGLITDWMATEDSNKKYEDYRTTKYDNEIGQTRMSLCAIQKGTEACKEGTYLCNLYKTFEKSQTKNSTENNLGKASDPKVNDLIRSMIGTPTKISKKSKEILVNAGILPKDDGEFVKQPDVPERKPEYVEKMSQIAKDGTATTTTTAAVTPKTKKTKADAGGGKANAKKEDNGTKANTADTTITDPTTTEPDMSQFDNEIMRRLSENRADPKKPVTKAEARKATREIFKKKGQKLSAAEEIAIADKVVDAVNNGTPLADAISEDDKATFSDDPSIYDEKEIAKRKKLEAYGGMAGAQGGANAGREAASDDGKEIKTVTIPISEAEVQLNLSDILDNKISKDDSDGKLLKSLIADKKDFKLLLKDTSFKVSFDKASNKFKVTFVSGDKKVAKDLQPQLEKYLNRVNGKAAPRKASRKKLLQNVQTEQ